MAKHSRKTKRPPVIAEDLSAAFAEAPTPPAGASGVSASAVPAGAARPASPRSMCAPSASPRLLAACCLLKLSRAAEAEAVLADAADADGGRDYYLGVALAHQGKIDGAVRSLTDACRQSGVADNARAALLALLKREAERKLALRDWEGAGAALTQAMELDPANADLQQMAAVLGDHLPAVFLKANRRADAAAAWEKAQKQNPDDLRLAHSLALLYFWWAQDLESQGKGKEAIPVWEGAIRNWVLLSYGDGFWSRWAEERAGVCGAVPPSAVDSQRRKLTEHLARRIADYQNDYLTQKRKDDSHRMGLVSLELAAELRTAEALKQVAASLQRQGRKANLPPLCGVQMLTHLGHMETAQRLLALVETTQTNELSTQQLHWCLSPWVSAWIMVQERRHDEAVKLLEKKLKENPSSQDGHDLLSTALFERGKLLASGGEVEQALAAWAAALPHVRGRQKLRDEIREQAEKAAVKEATRLQGEGDRQSVEAAIRMLEKALKVADTRRVKENLSELLTTRGVIEGNDTSQSEGTRRPKAKRYLDRALELNSNNGRAKSNLAIVLMGEAAEPFQADRYEEALRILRRAYELAPGDARQTLSIVLSNYGVHRWNRGSHAEGDRLLREALEIDPSNDHARKNLLAGGGSGLDPNDIESLMRLLRNR